MSRWLSPLALLVCSSGLFAATFGTSVSVLGGAADLVLDEPRGRLYLVNTSLSRVEVYSIAQRRMLSPIPTDSTPISAAISRSGKSLYVTSYDSSSVNIIDLDTQAVASRVSLPARPEGIAVGNDERVLITTVGAGANNAAYTLLLYNPRSSGSVDTIAVAPAAATPPVLPPPSGRPFLSTRSQLAASRDGSIIAGVNIPTAANTRVVFVYEVASASVLRSRTVTNASDVLSISPDGSRFMTGVNLFDSATLALVAQQNVVNVPYPMSTGVNFNTQTNQGGSVFAPDNSAIYSAFDISPVQNPPARANVSQLMINDPDNLLVKMGLQLPENMSGKMVISNDGGTIYALSESGFTIIPLSTLNQSPIVTVDSSAGLTVWDICGVNSALRTTRINVRNAGRGNLTVQALPVSNGVLGATGTPPSVAVRTTTDGSALDFTINSAATRSMGTVTPASDFALQSAQAVNIPPQVRIFQNVRSPEARGELYPIPVGIAANSVQDMAYDSARQRIYLANAAQNRIEVFDTQTKSFLTPVKTGQLPASMALSPDGNTLYVACAGGESIQLIDTVRLQVVGRVRFPAIPLNAANALITPSVIVAHQGGAMFVTSAGQLWDVTGLDAVPRRASAVIGATAAGLPVALTSPFTMASTPGGERVIVLNGNGWVYLYDALLDDFVQGRQVFTTIQGYYGPVAAGPAGRYYAVNGTLLNDALGVISSIGTTPGLSGATGSVAAVAQAGATGYVRFMQPTRASTTAVVTDPGSFEIADATTGQTRLTAPALEGPATVFAGTARATIGGRLLAVDPAGAVAYAASATGLSVIPLDPVNTADRPVIATRGVVNLGSYQTSIAQNGLVSIFGRNLGSGTAQAPSLPLPTVLGGACVTLGTTVLPLFASLTGQINVQIPPEVTAGSYALVVHNTDKRLASTSQTVTISKYAPAVVVDPVSGQIGLYHSNGKAVTKDNPAKRDEPLVMYAVGLGLTTGGRVTGGAASPASPLATAPDVEVFFGDPTWKQAAIIVDWAGLVPGYIGLYQINLRVPGFHISGDKLLVTLKSGGVASPSSGPVVPYVAVD